MSGGHKCYKEKYSKVKRQGNGGHLSEKMNVSRDLERKEVTAIIMPLKTEDTNARRKTIVVRVCPY